MISMIIWSLSCSASSWMRIEFECLTIFFFFAFGELSLATSLSMRSMESKDSFHAGDFFEDLLGEKDLKEGLSYSELLSDAEIVQIR